jgi:hypothetical protein
LARDSARLAKRHAEINRCGHHRRALHRRSCGPCGHTKCG